MHTHVKMPSLVLLDAERCESGRIDMLGKHASWQRDRGFESHPLRHNTLRMLRPLLFTTSYFVRVNRDRSVLTYLGELRMRIGAGPCAMEPCEPRQVRKEATVNSQFCVPQDHLAPLLFSKLWEVEPPDLLATPNSPSCLSILKTSLAGRG